MEEVAEEDSTMETNSTAVVVGKNTARNNMAVVGRSSTVVTINSSAVVDKKNSVEDNIEEEEGLMAKGDSLVIKRCEAVEWRVKVTETALTLEGMLILHRVGSSNSIYSCLLRTSGEAMKEKVEARAVITGTIVKASSGAANTRGEMSSAEGAMTSTEGATTSTATNMAVVATNMEVAATSTEVTITKRVPDSKQICTK